MKNKNLLMTAVATLGLSAATIAQTWNLLIPPSDYDISQLNFSNTAFNQNNSSFYSVYKEGTNFKIQSFNLNSNTVNLITTSNLPPVNLYAFTYDYTNNRLIANRAGRDNLYAVSATGGAWSQIGNGSTDSESYGGQFFWNSSNNSTGFFGGYGFGYTKNWIWENSTSWSNPYVNNTICDNSNPAKRNYYGYALGAPSSNKLYLFSGFGSCSGQQNVPSCSLGSPWANDIGVYCWLKDLWEINLTTHQFTNILPVNSSSISKEGQIVYDYMNNTFYILGGFVPPATYDPNFNNITDFETGVLRFRVGIDSDFTPFTVGGTPPPTVKISNLGPHAAYYDALNNQIIWARKDGIWAFSTCQQPTQPTTACYETATFNATSCSWEVTGTQPAQPTLACYETANFNTNSCSWEVTGTQPAQPTLACYETANFNTTSCQWEVTGTQPVQPTLACYETANFNTNSCSWEVTGTQPVQPTLACYETANFNTTSCQWEVTGTQPAQPTLACYETANFNTTSCSWDVSGTQPSITVQPLNQTVNVNDNVQFIVAASEANATFQWQTDLGVGFQNLNSVGQYGGTNTNTLSVSNVTLTNNNQPFRCIINSGSCSDTSEVSILTVKNNVGVNELTNENLFSVYPNPAHNIVNVSADSKLIGSSYTILDNTGRIVLQGKIVSENTTIDLQNLSGGIYLFGIGENLKQTFKIIKAE